METKTTAAADARELGGSLDDVRAFCAVVDFGSITAAARNLGETKSSISRRVTRLERRLGSALLARQPRAVSATEEGIAFHAKAGAALALLDDATEAASEAHSLPRGHLRLTAPVDFGLEVLPEAISVFRRRYPQITVELLLTSSTLDLATHRIDLALRASSELPDMDYRAAPLVSFSVRLYATPAYLAERGEPSTPAALAEHDVIAARDLMGPTAVSLSNGRRTERVCVRPAVQTDEPASVARIVLAGGGIGPLPDVGAAPALQDGRLQAVLPRWTVSSARLYAITIAGREAPARVRLFKEFLRERLAGLGACAIE
ncbi:LysR family transcriptional regulator [Aquisalimonas lutea]|uniref:LysR family transcriptional regulator n=1 Tax=Aquisalimonas lutea TaxID=1327750 RepID=UPI0025B5EE9F|nr:LysR family transcriptional regulator [Aquisalimonas lutea]MDN3516376.1 LysR family transcriptional regulator [Aquisalimonas lutea]